MKQIELSLLDENGQLIETFLATFESTDFALFRSFVKYMSRVRTCSILQRGMSPISRINWNKDSGLTFTSKPYTDAELHELLHVLRPVILQQEATSFHNVATLLNRRLSSNKNCTAQIKELRNLFDHGEQSMYMKISINEQSLFHDSLLKMYLYGEQYHTDAEKAATWQKLESSLSTENARALVMNQLYHKVKALFHLEYIINLVLKKSEEIV